MAGRAAILQLLPLSLAQTPKLGLLTGGYPEALARPRDAARCYAPYGRQARAGRLHLGAPGSTIGREIERAGAAGQSH